MSHVVQEGVNSGYNVEQIWKMAGERPAFRLEGPCFTRHMLFRLKKENNPRYVK
jgi:hypothetical protein